MALKIHWKAPLQTKGFFKIIEFVVAILCLSMVASYHFSGTLICPGATKNHTRTVTVETSYPLYSWTLRNVTITPLNPPNGDTTPGTPIVAAGMNGNFDNLLLGQGAQLYVTWSVATLFYCIVATLVYMVVTANEELEKVMDLLVYADLIFHVVWVFFWFIASVDWAVQYNMLFAAINNVLNLSCRDTIFPQPPSYSSTAQAGIAVVFGFLSLFLWAVNIFWVFIDTPWYIQRKVNSGSYEATP